MSLRDNVRNNLAREFSWSEPAFIKRSARVVRLVPLWFHIIPAALFALMLYIGFVVRPAHDPW